MEQQHFFPNAPVFGVSMLRSIVQDYRELSAESGAGPAWGESGSLVVPPIGASWSQAENRRLVWDIGVVRK